MKKEVLLFTDGSCLGNPGKGGFGVILTYGTAKKELSEGYEHTTNNRMELMAVIKGLQALKEPCAVKVFTDSKYVKDGVSAWMEKWKLNGWQTAAKTPVKNKDLWLELDRLKSLHDLSWEWVKGHAGHPENEHCDLLARLAANGNHLHATDCL